MKISYAITVCNEAVEIQRLISFLLENKRSEDEVVVLLPPPVSILLKALLAEELLEGPLEFALILD